MARSLQLWCGSTKLSLNSSTYILQAAPPFRADATTTVFTLLVKGSTIDAVEQHVNLIRRILANAQTHEETLSGNAVFVYTKTCDSVGDVAELGATWRRRRVLGGKVATIPIGGVDVAALPNVLATVTLYHRDPSWERATPTAVMVSSSANVTVNSDGGIIVPASATITARRSNALSKGLTLRVWWQYTDADITFLKIETGTYDVTAYYQASNNTLYMQDKAANIAGTTGFAPTVGDMVEIVFRWDSLTPSMKIFVNGTVMGLASLCELNFTEVDTYTIENGTSAQTIYSYQLWPVAYSDAICAAFYAYGKPEPELAFVVNPANNKNTNAFYKIYNVPGTLDAFARIVLSNYSSSTDYDAVAYAFRPLQIQATHLFECESGTLGTDVATNSNSDASGGSQARFTPSATSWVTRVTLVLCADPDDVQAYNGYYRLYLACCDNAAATGINQLQWRLVVAGVAEPWSETIQVGAVSTRLLVDLGEMQIPPGAWPAETLSATTDVHAGSYITLEIQSANTTGTGGGTFDFDALYLAPAEIEGLVIAIDWDNTDEYCVLDWVSDPPAAITVRDYRSMEFASWATLNQDAISLPPNAGNCGGLWVYCYRDTTDQAYPNDQINAWLYYRPRWTT